MVTSLGVEAWEARRLYEGLYCARGEMENRIKEQLMLFADRTSTAWLRSNQIRLYFSSLAYTLMEALRRLGLKGTDLAQAQGSTMRLKLLKIGALVRITVRRVWVSMAEGFFIDSQGENHIFSFWFCPGARRLDRRARQPKVSQAARQFLAGKPLLKACRGRSQNPDFLPRTRSEIHAEPSVIRHFGYGGLPGEGCRRTTVPFGMVGSGSQEGRGSLQKLPPVDPFPSHRKLLNECPNKTRSAPPAATGCLRLAR